MLNPEEVDQRLHVIETDMQALLMENRRLVAERESVYVELDSWVSLIAKLAHTKGLIVGLVSPTRVAIELPSGVVSFEFAESEAHLYEELPPYGKPLEMIENAENYRRIMNPGF